jgi:hypothetical protein
MWNCQEQMIAVNVVSFAALAPGKGGDGEAMTRQYLLWNLREAAEASWNAIRDIEADVDYSDAELQIAMTHIYHHLNTAWNARHASEERVAECEAADFRNWRQFPKDLDMSIGVE